MKLLVEAFIYGVKEDSFVDITDIKHEPFTLKLGNRKSKSNESRGSTPTFVACIIFLYL